MSDYTLDDLDDLDYGVRKVGLFAWRAEFWTKDGEPLWLGKVWRFRKKQAVIDVLTMVDLLIEDSSTESE